MLRKTTFGALAFSLGLCLLMPAAAETSPEAAKWMQKMIDAYGETAIKADFTMEMNAAQMGAPGGDAKANGTMMMDGKNKRQRMKMDITVNVPQMGEMTMSMVQVHDGETIWTEMENPMMGGTMVMKMTKAQMEKMSEMQGMSGMTSSTPFGQEQFEEMKEAFDWTLDGVAGGRVTLSAEITAEGMASVSGSMPEEQLEKMDDLGRMVMVLDEKNAMPVEMRLGSFMKMQMSNVQQIDAFPAGTFEYTPPEGAQVMDVGAMMGGG